MEPASYFEGIFQPWIWDVNSEMLELAEDGSLVIKANAVVNADINAGNATNLGQERYP